MLSGLIALVFGHFGHVTGYNVISVIMTTDNVAAINGETPIYIIGIYIITTTANVNISASTELKPFFPPTSHKGEEVKAYSWHRTDIR